MGRNKIYQIGIICTTRGKYHDFIYFDFTDERNGILIMFFKGINC